MAENIIVKKLSGKDFNRPHDQQLVRTLRPEDVLVFKSNDRLGQVKHVLYFHSTALSARQHIKHQYPLWIGGCLHHLGNSNIGLIHNLACQWHFPKDKELLQHGIHGHRDLIDDNGRRIFGLDQIE